jgi:putative transposase
MSESKKTRNYPSDLTDEEWLEAQKVFPEHFGLPGVSEVKYSVRDILNAIFYKQKTGCQWEMLPKDFPPWKTVTRYFYPWRKEGRFEKFRRNIVAEVRKKAGENPSPTAVILDSKSVPKGSLQGPTGIDGGKKIKGHKRHIATDKMGLILGVLVTPASVHDGVAGAILLGMIFLYYPTLQLVTGDSKYSCRAMEEVCQQTGIKYEERVREEGEKGFVPLPLRWPVERTFGWQMWSRQLSKGYDYTKESLGAWVDIAMTHLGLRRLFGRSARLRQLECL